MSKVYQIVTDRILTELEKGHIPWKRPWTPGDYTSGPANYSGRHYNGMNFIFLSMLNYDTPIFLTYKQIQKLGGRIREGQEKSHTPVYLWLWMEKENEKGEKVKIPIFRYFLVWNIEQTDGIEVPAWFTERSKGDQRPPIEMAEGIFNAMPNRPNIAYGGNRACYHPCADYVHSPNREQFPDLEEFYSTMFHELAHSTGHSSRLNRKEVMGIDYFGSHNYSLEELVAELTSAFLCAESGIDNTLQNSAAYIGGWFEKLKKEPKLFATAAARAAKAADYILSRNAVQDDAGE